MQKWRWLSFVACGGVMDLMALVEWLKGFVAAKDFVQAIVLVAGMSAILFAMRRERRKISFLIVDLTERVDTMSQLARAARAEFETAMARPVSGQVANGGASNWENVQTIWRETRDRIELAIENILDRRVKPKYGKIPRYNYNDVIITLRDDRLISEKVYGALTSMNSMFQRLKLRPSAVTAAEVELFQRLLKDVNGGLPRLPKPKTTATALVQMQDAAE
jgi:hypothetical protein